jgi:hypothetical protein
MDRDPNKHWSWANGEVSTPREANIQSSVGEPTPAPLGTSAIDSQLQMYGISKGIDAAADGVGIGIKAATAAPAPLMMGIEGAATGAGSQAAALAAQNAGLGAANAAAATAATNTALASATGAAPLAATGMGPALMASMASNPIGWAAGGYLLGKQFGIF